MPKLPEYDATERLQPSDIGVSAHENAARRIGAFYSQMATATKQVADMEKENDDLLGKQLETFLRFQSLEAETSTGGGFKVLGGGKAERTLIGSGTNSGITRNYANLNELSNGSKMLSAAAKNLVAAGKGNSVENGVDVLRGRTNTGSDMEHGVTVFRGGRPFDPGAMDQAGNPLTPLTAPTRNVNPQYYNPGIPANQREQMLYGPEPTVQPQNAEGKPYAPNEAVGRLDDIQGYSPTQYGPNVGGSQSSQPVQPYQESIIHRDGDIQPWTWPTNSPQEVPDAGPTPTGNSGIQGWNDIDEGIDYG